MANWAYTDYVIEGPKETLEKIHDAILHCEIQENSSEGWEGNVLMHLGITWDRDKKYMRGFIQKDTVDLTDTTLSFGAEEAWGATDFHEMLQIGIPDIKVYYRVDEPDDAVYATNDKEGKYFTERYFVDTCIDGNCESEYFTTEEEAYKWLSHITQGRVHNFEELDQFNDDYEDTEYADENWIRIYEFDIVD